MYTYVSHTEDLRATGRHRGGEKGQSRRMPRQAAKKGRLRKPQTPARVRVFRAALSAHFRKLLYSVLQNGCPCRKKSKVSKVSRGVREARAEAREGDQTDEVILVASPKMSTAPPAPCALLAFCLLPLRAHRASSSYAVLGGAP
jgi:hypothetical protein